MMKRLCVCVGLVCLMLCLAACGGEQTVISRTITHVDGSALQVPEQAQRLAAVYGPAYESLVVLGAEQQIVICADVQWENFPWAQKIFTRITQLPYLVNVHSAVNTEELLQQNPDLVFTFARPNELNQLQKMGVAAVSGVTSRHLADVKNLLLVYAEALGTPEALDAAQRYADYFDAKRQMITQATADIPLSERPKVYYAGVDLLTTYGKYSDICELIEDAGGVAVTKDLEAGNRVQINFEQLATWNPDYIFIDHGGMNDKETAEEILAQTQRNQRYAVVKAVENGQVYLSPSGVFYWDMGLQKILLLMYVAKTIHPEIFADLDLVQEIQYFYQEFFHYPLTVQEAQQILRREDP